MLILLLRAIWSVDCVDNNRKVFYVIIIHSKFECNFHFDACHVNNNPTIQQSHQQNNNICHLGLIMSLRLSSFYLSLFLCLYSTNCKWIHISVWYLNSQAEFVNSRQQYITIYVYIRIVTSYELRATNVWLSYHLSI